MSQRTGPYCLVPYKRMEDQDVVPDRTLLLGFPQKNGGEGCHVGQDLVGWFRTGERKIMISSQTEHCCFVFIQKNGG